MPDGGGHAHVGARDPVRDGALHGLVRDRFATFAALMQEGGRVLPTVPYRQWALSLPWELRPPVARDPALLNAVSRVSVEEVRGRACSHAVRMGRHQRS